MADRGGDGRGRSAGVRRLRRRRREQRRRRRGERQRRRARPARSPSCCRTRSRRCAGRRSTGRSCRQAFEAAGVEVEIQNAEGDKATQQQQAEQAITNGAKVLLLVNLDSGSGAAIAANAKSQDVKVIDYDRLTLDTDATDYYVSFDNEQVGKLQGEGLVSCLEAAGKENPQIAVLNGSPTDNNATLFKNGYDSVINPKFDAGDWTEVDDQSVPDWDNQKALTIFEQMLQKADNKIDGVLAANDGLGNAAISAIKQRKLDQIPVTGQDATLQGIQNIVNGDQCMTVYKAIKKEADAAAELAIALAKGEEPTAETTPVNNNTQDVPSVLLEPVVGDQGQHQRVPRRAGLPEEGGDLRRGPRRQVRGARALVKNGGPVVRRVPTSPGGGVDVTDIPVLELRGVSKSFGAVQALYRGGLPRRRRARSWPWSATTARASRR